MKTSSTIKQRIQFFKKLAQAGEGPNDKDVDPIGDSGGTIDHMVKNVNEALGTDSKYSAKPGVTSTNHQCIIFGFKKHKSGTPLTSSQINELSTKAKQILDHMAAPIKPENYYKILTRREGLIIISMLMYPRYPNH